MSMTELKTPIYNDGRTKQSFRDETDINKILRRAQKTGTVSHLTKYEARYGDFSDFDFFEVQLKLAGGRQIFDDLPSEIRNEFNQSPAQFFDYVNDPANKDDLLKKLPALAAPGRQNIDVSGKTAVADSSEAKPIDEKKAIVDPGVGAEKPLDGNIEASKTAERVGEAEKAGEPAEQVPST